ncbi:hypothetical protein BROSI_A1592 [Candidatus Brocadia sinica JPN1]|uniref:Uncharacterized protein n=1 Tax=Candidatus Brocadia sinica JPN1 TaxID=1197129 RepID=A0ABQ0JWJ2_9BACT|nr:hypothetical protein BROSI_A1592 [Candidatus Brocadia sinica JPN1]GIK14685.1 MAG: hypothetical protein BroJett002_33920 [Candidatus Brocadia sinica]GJQ16372.1 MAG: hypothetical protein HBSIN01_03310 [Candidatus Brocadia sinica]
MDILLKRDKRIEVTAGILNLSKAIYKIPKEFENAENMAESPVI